MMDQPAEEDDDDEIGKCIIHGGIGCSFVFNDKKMGFFSNAL